MLNFFCFCFFFAMNVLSYTPEQEKAFNVLREHVVKFHELHVTKLPSHPLETGYMAFSTNPIYKQHLPMEDWWHWNQSNGKVETYFNTTKVVLQKFNTRKKNQKDNRNASYKLWLYSIFDQNNQSICCFVWCEKGVERNEIREPISYFSNQIFDHQNDHAQQISQPTINRINQQKNYHTAPRVIKNNSNQFNHNNAPTNQITKNNGNDNLKAIFDYFTDAN